MSILFYYHALSTAEKRDATVLQFHLFPHFKCAGESHMCIFTKNLISNRRFRKIKNLGFVRVTNFKHIFMQSNGLVMSNMLTFSTSRKNYSETSNNFRRYAF